MKHVFSVLSVACVAFFTLFLSTTNVSCKKGDTGPKGDTGVANAVYSAWLDVTYKMQVPQPGDTGYVATITAPKLDQTALDKGSIHVYFNFGSATQSDIVPLPYFDGSNIINPSFGLNTITLVSNVNASTVTSGGSKVHQYRYIIVNGSVPGRQAVNWNNYAEVKELYNIKD
jgi:hypothetical protein